jgi:hypothetical protein
VRAVSPLPWPARLEALLHLSLWVAHPMSLLLLLLALPLVIGEISLTLNLTVLTFVALGPILVFALAQRQLYADWPRRLLTVPVLALLGTGLALSNTLAIVQGLLRRGQTFRRTPKFRLERRADRWIGSRYSLPFQWVTLAELGLAGYALASMVIAVWLRNYYFLPFLLLYMGGYGTIGLHGLRDAWRGQRLIPHPRRAPAVADY